MDETMIAAVEAACEVMHDAYEAAAEREGWETQERSRKPWADVPEANKATMRAAVAALLDSPLLDQRVRAAKAEALREAADDFQRQWPVYGDDWLRDRAASYADQPET